MYDFPVFETPDFKIFPGEHIPLEDETTKLSKSNFAPGPQCLWVGLHIINFYLVLTG